MYPNMLKFGECPRGSKCTNAHSEEEKEHYRRLLRGKDSSLDSLQGQYKGPGGVGLPLYDYSMSRLNG